MLKEQKGIMCRSTIINKSSGKFFLPHKLNILAYNFKEHGEEALSLWPVDQVIKTQRLDCSTFAVFNIFQCELLSRQLAIAFYALGQTGTGWEIAS